MNRLSPTVKNPQMFRLMNECAQARAEEDRLEPFAAHVRDYYLDLEMEVEWRNPWPNQWESVI
jgi:hypothetical protein